ncbi:MAG: c-type cytochrome [Myxococcaceae bacterium]|jgi:YVTN family beta-propeller protein|nr:c-type cytochrome [Myxococcaceae bacterium]
MNWFKRAVLVGALAAGSLLSACAPAVAGNSSRSSGSLALSADDSTLYAVDSDNGVLAVMSLVNPSEKYLVPVGKEPVRLIIGADETVYVANRGSNTVSVIRKGERQVSATLETSVEPSGLALSADGKQLLVTSATARDTTAHGVLTAFDTATLQQAWELPVGEEPRAVAVVAGNKALVSLYKKGEVAVVDLNRQALTSNPTNAQVYTQANAARTDPNLVGSGFGGTFSTFHPRAASDIITTPDGTRAFTPVVWAREDAIGRRPSSAGGYYSAGGPCSIGAVATAGIVTYDTAGATAQPKVDDLTACINAGTNTNTSADFPVSTFASSSGGLESAVQGPTVGVTDPTGAWVFVVNRESQNVVVLPADRRAGEDIDFNSTGTSIRSMVRVGAGADGIAVTRDGTRAYVYNQFDKRVDELVAKGVGAKAQVVKKGEFRFDDVGLKEVLSPEFAMGRRMFFDALDARMSSPQTTVACSTCHLEGREDGHVWMFPDGPRQTPALAGRKLLATAPYHWSGEFPTINDFNVHTIRERMGGVGLGGVDAVNLDRWVDSLPSAPSPFTPAMDVVQRGRAAFEKAQCATCHSGTLLTDNTNRNVGTLNTRASDPRERDNGLVERQGFNVPSLHGLARSAPYLHDGTELTLEARVFGNARDQHGVTSTLSDVEKADLVAYLKSL